MANEESFILNHDPYIDITVTYGRDAVYNHMYDLIFPNFNNKTTVIGFDAEWIVRNPDASSSSKDVLGNISFDSQGEQRLASAHASVHEPD